MIKAAHPGFQPRWNNFAVRPYLLNSELDGKDPVSKIAHLEQKLGKPVSEMGSVMQLLEQGRKYGLLYRYEPEDLASGTLDSHRLMRYAARESGTDAVQRYRRHLMRLFNEEGQALSDRRVLLSAIESAGLRRDAAADVLDSDDYRTDVQLLDQDARAQGIRMVPMYRFHIPDGLHVVTDFYNEWHFLDALYHAFSDEQRQWAHWEEAGKCASEIVAALNELNELQRKKRRGGEIAEEDIHTAQEMVDVRVGMYRQQFL